MKLYIIRHGQTDWNKTNRLQGKTDIPLNEEGRRVAKLTGAGMRNIRIDAVISSPLIRAVETAALALELPMPDLNKTEGGMDLSQLFGMPFYTDERIMEMSFGDYEGLSSLNPAYPLTDPDFHLFMDSPALFKAPPHGENCWDVMRRCGNFLMDMAEKAARDAEDGIERTILISGHGAVVRALITLIEHKSTADYWKDGVPKNCSVTIAESHGDPWKLLEKDKIYYEDI